MPAPPALHHIVGVADPQVCSELLEARSPDGAVVLKSIVGSCSAQLAGGNTTAGEGGAGWLRGAVEVLGKLCPAVASYQGVQVLG